jgi:hypothetical protein
MATPAVSRLASGNPKVGHLSTRGAHASQIEKGHQFLKGVVPYATLRGYSVQSAIVSVPNGNQQGEYAYCPTGTVVVGGGAFASSGSLGANINTSAPLSDGSAWEGYESNTTGATDDLTVYAICAKKPRYYAIEQSPAQASPANDQVAAAVVCPATYKVLSVGAAETSSDTAVNLNGLYPYEAAHPTRYGTLAYGNNASSSDSTLYAFAVCGKLKGYSFTQSAGVANNAGSQDFVGQACPSGTVPTGGGIQSSSSSTAVNVNATYPNPGFTGWGAYENNASGSGDTIYAFAICAL